jgi:hypothetical protein
MTLRHPRTSGVGNSRLRRVMGRMSNGMRPVRRVLDGLRVQHRSDRIRARVHSHALDQRRHAPAVRSRPRREADAGPGHRTGSLPLYAQTISDRSRHR